MKIKKAILPVAGFGTRFLPATKAQPKETLPIFDTPAIEFIVRELVESGIEDIIVITGREKRAIEDYFDRNGDLERLLEQKGKLAELEQVRAISDLANFAFVRQDLPLGDGHAILQAKKFIESDESVVVCFGDDLVDNPGGKNAIQQLLEIHDSTLDPVVLLERVPPEAVEKYGIVEMQDGKITSLVEKPKPENAPSNLGVVGKFILTPEIFHQLDTIQSPADGEIRLTSALEAHFRTGGTLRGRVLDGVRFDTGDKIGFLKATLHFARKKDPDGVREVISTMKS